MELLFYFCLGILFYTYLGYPFILFIIVKIKDQIIADKSGNYPFNELPSATLLVAAYNEKDFIEAKIENSLKLTYPDKKLKFLFITDGSDDGTPDLVKRHPLIDLMHQPVRQGKIAAVHRAMSRVSTAIVVYSDANTLLNKDAVINLVRHFKDKKVGAVAGEKRIISNEKDKASGAGEGIYWKYESLLKKWDAKLYSVVGAAGELFSIRTELYEKIPSDTIIEDFYLTLRIAQKGFRVKYEPDSVAMERPSASVKEELKRKIRIAAGGLQAIIRLKALLNPVKYGILSFQYVSHRVLRWTLAPIALAILLFSNILLALNGYSFYNWILIFHLGFYLLALAGYLLEKKKIKLKIFFIPYYFLIMNYAVYAGFFRFLTKSQSVLWERAKRG